MGIGIEPGPYRADTTRLGSLIWVKIDIGTACVSSNEKCCTATHPEKEVGAGILPPARYIYLDG